MPIVDPSIHAETAETSPSRVDTLPVAILLGPWHGIAAVVLAVIDTVTRLLVWSLF